MVFYIVTVTLGSFFMIVNVGMNSPTPPGSIGMLDVSSWTPFPWGPKNLTALVTEGISARGDLIWF